MARLAANRRRALNHFLPAHIRIAVDPGECGPCRAACLERYFDRIAPENPGLYEHNDEGPDDMPAHIRTALTQTQLSIPVEDGRMVLGTWQGIFLFEHRHEAPQRKIALHAIGDAR